MLKKLIILFCICIFSLSCSKSVKGPLTGKKYNVNVGGWGDMDKYKDARDDAMDPSFSKDSIERPLDCNVVDCPDNVREGVPY